MRHERGQVLRLAGQAARQMRRVSGDHGIPARDLVDGVKPFIDVAQGDRLPLGRSGDVVGAAQQLDVSFPSCISFFLQFLL